MKTVVSITPKTLNMRMNRNPTSPTIGRNTGEPDLACQKISKVNAVSFQDAIDILRAWRSTKPNAMRLDGMHGKGSNPSPWLHFRVEGYSSTETFQSRHGDIFTGDDYNGIVNLHGDAKSTAIDNLILAIDSAECYQDVLRPSATYETKGKPEDKFVRPKFVMLGFEGRVDGFFLYHDDWKPKKPQNVA